MIKNRNPASMSVLGGAGDADLAAERVGVSSRSKTPTRKVKYFGRPDHAASAAMRMVTAAFGEPGCKRLQLFTIPDRTDDPLPAGLSAAEVCFDRSQIDEAVRWTTGCLAAGWILFRRVRS